MLKKLDFLEKKKVPMLSPSLSDLRLLKSLLKYDMIFSNVAISI